LRDEASDLVQKRKKLICADEEMDGIDGTRGNIMLYGRGTEMSLSVMKSQ
jgi:hypothetical protein